jgi:hypothetical protein
MKHLTLLSFLCWYACKAPSSHASIDNFWQDFQQAILRNDPEAVANLTAFPLLGAEFVLEKYDNSGISRQELLQHFEQIFDETAKATIAKTTVKDLQQYLPPKDAVLERLSLPPNTIIYYINIFNVIDEGLETQTESLVNLYFLQTEGVYKLAYLTVAG